MKKVDITVIICTWNRAQLLKKAIEALQQLEIPNGLSWEVLIVDNASTDDTQIVAKEFINDLPLRVISEPRSGKSYAANTGVEQSRGEYILWTDDDALVERHWIVSFLSAFERFQADVVYGKVEPWWETEAPSWFSEDHYGRFALLDHGPTECVMKELSGFGVNYAFRKEVFSAIGPFETQLGPTKRSGFGGEDTLIFENALRKGLVISYTPYALVRHFIPSERCKKAYHRNRVWVGSKQDLWLLRANFADLPGFLGIPRFMFKAAAQHLLKYAKALALGKRSTAFKSELEMIRLGGLIWYGFRERLSNH